MSGYTKQHRGFHGMYSEDNWTAEQRMEQTSRIETRMENDEKREAGEGDGWLAAGRNGDVRYMKGEPNAAAISGEGTGENEIEALRRNRLAQMKARAEQRKQWMARGHGAYVSLADEAELLSKLPNHERAVVLFSSRKFPGHLSQLLHTLMRALADVHFETFFAHLDSDSSPMIKAMVDIPEGPVLLLCQGGRVTGQLAGIDSSYTAEGIAYELGLQGLVNFDDGIQYGKVAGGCTTATARQAAAQASDDSEEDD
jgi:hypothetical protein